MLLQNWFFSAHTFAAGSASHRAGTVVVGGSVGGVDVVGGVVGGVGAADAQKPLLHWLVAHSQLLAQALPAGWATPGIIPVAPADVVTIVISDFNVSSEVPDRNP